MNNQQLYDVSVCQQLKEMLGEDICQTISQIRADQVTFVFDWSQKMKAKIYLLSGDLSSINLDPSILTVGNLFARFDMENPMAQVYGEKAYGHFIFRALERVKDMEHFNIPIKHGKKTQWLSLNLKRLKTNQQENDLIFGYVYKQSYEIPKAVLFYQAQYRDTETGLFNKESLKFHLLQLRGNDSAYGLYLDIDHFKSINDIYGHRFGDQYLKLLAKRFNEDSEPGIRYYRIGGDEFFVYLRNANEKKARFKAMEIIQTIETLTPEAREAGVSASVGIVAIDGLVNNFEDLMESADNAMYYSKRKGKGNISHTREV